MNWWLWSVFLADNRNLALFSLLFHSIVLFLISWNEKQQKFLSNYSIVFYSLVILIVIWFFLSISILFYLSFVWKFGDWLIVFVVDIFFQIIHSFMINQIDTLCESESLLIFFFTQWYCIRMFEKICSLIEFTILFFEISFWLYFWIIIDYLFTIFDK